MERPQSIIWFERLYLGSVAIGLANSALNWSRIQAQAAAVPNSAVLPSWFLGATVGFGIIINVLLWYLIARRRSVVAKWILTVLFAVGLPGLVSIFSGVRSGLILPSMALVTVVLFVIQGAAIFMLFRADAKPWFDKSVPDLEDTFS